MVEEANNLLNSLEDVNIDDQIRAIQSYDLLEDLKKDVYKFFSQRLSYIQDKESFTEKVQKKLEEFLDRDELNFDQILSLYRLGLSKTSEATDSITSLFRPTPGAPSPFADNIAKSKESDDFENSFENMTPEDLRKLDKVFRAMLAMSKITDDEE